MRCWPTATSLLAKTRGADDLLIAAAAETRGLTVLHYDSDFDQIAGATGRCV